MKILGTAILAFLLGVGVTYGVAMYTMSSVAQMTAQTTVQRESALVDFLETGNYDHVKDILVLSICANRDYLEEQSQTIFWNDIRDQVT